jgi:L-2-hydroxyglutarate oxidase
MPRSLIVIGGGIVGLATAYKILRAFPGVELTLLEKESALAQHQSSHNSGVLHAGLAYKPGSEKARLAASGLRQMLGFCAEYGIPYDVCGKLVVATNDLEVERLRELHQRGEANGLQGLAWLEPPAMREIEPHVGGVAGLRVPGEGIVDYPAVCAALARLVGASGGRIVTGAEVHGIRRTGASWAVETAAGGFSGDLFINCAGLHCDRIARLSGERPAVRIIPFRGEYYRLRADRAHLVRHLIYPAPDPAYPFLGVHFTRRIQGGIDAGPNAVLAFAREGYDRWTVRPGDLLDALTFPGLWRFLAQHAGMVRDELRRSLSRRLFAAALQRLVPELVEDDLVPGGSGVRAQAMLPDGTLVQDFQIVTSPGAIHVLNAPSPAATCALAIADELILRARGQLDRSVS